MAERQPKRGAAPHAPNRAATGAPTVDILGIARDRPYDAWAHAAGLTPIRRHTSGGRFI